MKEQSIQTAWGIIQAIFAAVGGFLGWFWGGIDGAIYALIAFTIADYLTGVFAAFIRKELSSEVGAKGIVKKLTIYIMVGIGHLVDFYLLNDGNALRTALIFFYAANELVSLIENAAVIGLPVPQVLQDALIQIKRKSGGTSDNTKNVRFIAAADNLDSANGFDIMSIFRDVFNEFYVSDCSRKQRAAQRVCALQGKSGGKMPYGYIEDKNDRSKWLIDEEKAEVVREMFKLFVSGTGIAEICRIFSARGIPTPQPHRNKRSDPPTWAVSGVCPMLEEEAYIGTFTAQKATTVSYKNHTRIYRPKEEWVRIENHHPPIIDMETWDTAQRLRGKRRRYNKLGEKSILSGLVFCNDCGSTLSYCLQGAGGKTPNFICKKYRYADCNNNHKCTRHGIRVEDLEHIVLTQIQSTVDYARRSERKFVEIVHCSQNSDTEKQIKKKTAEFDKAERRIVELDTIISRIYEDHVTGKLSEERFGKMLDGYETEQKALSATAEFLRAEIDELQTKTANLESFMKLVARVGDITELSEELARMFIEKIVVHEAVFKEGTKRAKVSQQVDVYFAYIGQFNPSDESEEFHGRARNGNLIYVN